MEKRIKTGIRDIRSAETKERIIKSAEVLFKENGLDNVSLNAVITHAGVSKGSFYSHFDSKDSLEAHFINDTISRMDLSYDRMMDSFADQTPVAGIFSSLLEKVAQNITEDLGYPLVKTAGLIQIRKTTNHEILKNFSKGLYSAVYKLVNRGLVLGEFKTADSAETVADDIVMTINGFILEWVVRYPDMNLKDCMKNHFKIYFAGLL
ncbi:MAG TPA: TetR/AcrR family transcriptional regulator [Clostridia bacterium]|nr:TetR/AcrR family transcriptional regulator [Clostridia bacterium]